MPSGTALTHHLYRHHDKTEPPRNAVRHKMFQIAEQTMFANSGNENRYQRHNGQAGRHPDVARSGGRIRYQTEQIAQQHKKESGQQVGLIVP